MTKPHLTRADTVRLLELLIDGTYQLKPTLATWDAVYAGNVEFSILQDDMLCGKITFFNDCDELDYVHEVDLEGGILPQYEHGAYGDYDGWDVEDDTRTNPLELLSETAILQLETICREALPLENA